MTRGRRRTTTQTLDKQTGCPRPENGQRNPRNPRRLHERRGRVEARVAGRGANQNPMLARTHRRGERNLQAHHHHYVRGDGRLRVVLLTGRRPSHHDSLYMTMCIKGFWGRLQDLDRRGQAYRACHGAANADERGAKGGPTFCYSAL